MRALAALPFLWSSSSPLHLPRTIGLIVLLLSSACHRSQQEANDAQSLEEANLRKNARIQLWLKDHFEAQTKTKDIPRATLDNLLEQPKAKSNFHPKLHLLCQAIVVPDSEQTEANKKTKQETSSPISATWRRNTKTVVEQLHRLMLHFRPDLLREKDCDFFASLVELAEPKSKKRASKDSNYKIRFESGGFDLSLPDRWDKDFVAAVRPIQTPTLLEPFSTQFGEHIVFVFEVKDPVLSEGSEAPDELAKKRREHLRTLVHPSWQSEQFQQMLTKLRNKYVVRFSTNWQTELNSKLNSSSSNASNHP